MKRSAGLLLVLLSGLLLAHGEPDRPNQPLYLHCFRPTYGLKAPGSKDRTPAELPVRLVSIMVTPGHPFDIAVGPHHHKVSGTINRAGDSFTTTLKGSFGGSWHHFDGPITIEIPFDPELDGYVSMASPFRCVLSTRRDPQPFLDAQAALDRKKVEDK